jgi:hypothetical protein
MTRRVRSGEIGTVGPISRIFLRVTGCDNDDGILVFTDTEMVIAIAVAGCDMNNRWDYMDKNTFTGQK